MFFLGWVSGLESFKSRSPSKVPFLTFFFLCGGGGVPLLKWTTEKVGTLIPTSVLEDLV